MLYQLNSNDTISNVYSSRGGRGRGRKQLPPTFQPGCYDVKCARGKNAYQHEGNQRFRGLVRLHQESYRESTCKYEKSKIVSHIVNTIRHHSPDGGFVKRIDGVWYEVGDRAAKEKVGQTFRDLLHTKYSSSTKAKARVRVQRRIDEYSISDDLPPVVSSCSPLLQNGACHASIVSDDPDDRDDIVRPTQSALVIETEPANLQYEQPLMGQLSDSMETFDSYSPTEFETSKRASFNMTHLSFDDELLGAELTCDCASFEVEMKDFCECMGISV